MGSLAATENLSKEIVHPHGGSNPVQRHGRAVTQAKNLPTLDCLQIVAEAPPRHLVSASLRLMYIFYYL